jgi:hypothetical protein
MFATRELKANTPTPWGFCMDEQAKDLREEGFVTAGDKRV